MVVCAYVDNMCRICNEVLMCYVIKCLCITSNKQKKIIRKSLDQCSCYYFVDCTIVFI